MNEQIFDGNVEVVWIETVQQHADIFTKALGNILFAGFRRLIGMWKGVQA